MIRGDCLEVLEALKVEGVEVDAVITDPPYGCQHANQVQARSVNDGTGRVESFDIAWNFDLPLEYIEKSAAILKPGGSFLTFTDTKKVETIWSAVQGAGLRPLQLVYWVKSNPPPQPRKNFQSAVEVAIFARKAGTVLHWGGGGATRNVFETSIAMGRDRTEHPTQKHADVMRWLIGLLCPPSGTALDPFGGSGTTAAAAMLEGRQSISIERDPEYFEIMRKRLQGWYDSDKMRQGELL